MGEEAGGIRTRARTLNTLILAFLLIPSLPAGAAPPPAPEGISDGDVAMTLLRLAENPDTAASLFLALSPGGAALPPNALARLDAPPSFARTLAALSVATGLPPGAPPPLPADLDRALSVLGQGLLGALELHARGDNAAGALLLHEAVERARPALERDTILLRHHASLAMDAPSTRARLDAIAGARDADAAMAALGIPPAPDVAPVPLGNALAQTYARLGLPVDLETRAGLAAASSLDPALRAPLELSLGHLLEAWRLRDEAFAALTPIELALLHATPALSEAAASPTPTPGELVLLATEGAALVHLDGSKMLLGAAHLNAASLPLGIALPPFDGLLPCCETKEANGDDAETRVVIGDLAVTFRSNARGDVRVETGGGGDALVIPMAMVAIDLERRAVVVFDDADHDLQPQASERRFVTPALADPANDILFQDPYGLVVVSGDGVTRTDASLGGRVVDASWGETIRVGDGGAAQALAQLDALLSPQDTRGVWPAANEWLRGALADDPAPTRVRVTVNPAAYQILRWDLGGDDVYLTNAAGAGARPLLVLGGDGAAGAIGPNATATPLPVTVLVDIGGNDTYRTSDPDTLAAANASLALLLDLGGSDRFELLGDGPGLASAATAGIALLLVGEGPATYTAPDRALGFAANGASALLVDAGGNDRYRGGNFSVGASDMGALALVLDLAGDDGYSAGALSHGASRGGIGALVDAAGNDTYDTSERADARGHAAPGTGLGPARIGLLFDAGGVDRDACPAGRASNALLGNATIAASLPGAFDPALGVCIDADAAVGAPGGVDVPPTFFASSFANFTIPGLARLGSLADDDVSSGYLLSVDILGNDTYATGAVAIADTSGSSERTLGVLAPVAVHVDTDGDDVLDAARAAIPGAGAFGYADGGIAIQAESTTRRFEVVLDQRAANATASPALSGESPDREAQMRRENASAIAGGLAYPIHHHRVANVTLGLGAAERGGVAIFTREGVALDVAAVSGVTCRLGCARTGGVALALGRGPNDTIEATPWSLGAVQESALGGLGIYYKRGGPDVFTGDNRSMAYVAREPSMRGAANELAALAEDRPNVALFVKDGFEADAYAPDMTYNVTYPTARANNKEWEDRATLDGFQTFGNRSLHVAMGVDNLDWYANANLAAADGGVAPGQGPSPSEPSQTVPADAPWWWDFVELALTTSQTTGVPWPSDTGQDATFRTVDEIVIKSIRNNFRSQVFLRNEAKQAYSTLNATAWECEAAAGSTCVAAAPVAGTEGSGGNLTTPYGVRPVTFARTAFNPTVTIESISLVTAGSGKIWQKPQGASVSATTNLRVNYTDPPAFADAVVVGSTLDSPPGSTPGAVSFGSTAKRMELAIVGTETWWTECPIWSMRDRIDPRACLVASWDRDLDNATGNDQVERTSYDQRRHTWQFNWSANQAVDRVSGRLAFPPGNYTVIVRAYAARPDRPVESAPAHDALVEGAASEALNTTDDSYGLYGKAVFADVHVLNPPQLQAERHTIISSDGTSHAHYIARVSEPVNYTMRLHALDPASTFQPVTLGPFYSEFFHAPAAFEAARSDAIHFEWDPDGAPIGGYVPTITMIGLRSNATSLPTPLSPIFVDDAAPLIGVQAEWMPETLNLVNTDQGRIILITDPDPVENDTSSRLRAAHLWVQEDILSAADPRAIVDSKPWRYVGATEAIDFAGQNQTGGTGKVARRDDSSTTRLAKGIAFQGEAEMGPPRRYRFALYLEDGAGNVRVADPTGATGWTPEGPDCSEACADFLYDISPPISVLAPVAPAPEVGRVARGNVTLRASAPETPDVGSWRTYALALPGTDLAAYDAALIGVPPTPAPVIPRLNLSLSRNGTAPIATAAEGLPLVAESFDLVFNVTSKLSNTTSIDVNPMLAWVNVTALNGTSVMGPLVYDLSPQLLPFFNRDSPAKDVRVPLPAINASGAYLVEVNLTMAAEAPENNATSNALREAVLVWERLPQPNATGALTWKPRPEYVAPNATLTFLSRAVDFAGNLEPKIEYDLRLTVDLQPPRLEDAPEVSPMSHLASVAFATDEPTTARLVVRDPSGAVVHRANETRASAFHALMLENLTPETRYDVVLNLTDEVGNANETTFNFTTSRAIDVSFTDVPTLMNAMGVVAWRVNATEELLVEHNLTLSLDGGATYPYDVKVVRFLAGPNATRNLTIDASGFPESSRARLRLETLSLGADRSRTVVYSPLFVLDAVAPVVNATAPRGLANYTNGDVTLTLRALDNASGVARVEWREGSSAWTAIDQGKLVLNGSSPRAIQIRARDVAGNVGAPKDLKILLDRAPPVVNAALPKQGVISAKSVAITLEGADEHAGIATIVGTEGGREAFRVLGRDLVRGKAVATWTLYGTGAEHALKIVATDTAGNAAERIVRIGTDQEIPHASFELTQRELDRIVLEVSFDEPVALEAQIARPGASMPLDVPSDLRRFFVLDADGLAPGYAHTFTLRAVDAAGNVATLTRTYSTPRDLEAPAAPSEFAAEPARDGGISLAWNAANDNGAIAAYHIMRALSGEDAMPIASTRATRFLDVEPRAGETVTYEVYAMDQGGNIGPGSGPVTIRARSAPILSNLTLARAPGSSPLVRIQATLTDVDGDEPAAWLLLDGHQVAMYAQPRGPGAWNVSAVVPVNASRIDVVPRYHLEADDGTFSARLPPAGEAALPPMLSLPVEESIAGLIGARVIPAAPVGLAFALVALLALLWRRR